MNGDSHCIPVTHPRHESLRMRERVVEGVRSGITSFHGLAAHGRGEAFDYLLGEKTHDFALAAIRAAAAKLLLAQRPVVSVNGNFAALNGKEAVVLSHTVGAKLEVNLFHHSDERVARISESLKRFGASEALEPQTDTLIPGLESSRRFVNSDGIASADVVFVPMEDGDRCRALKDWGKDVITVDLNPLSRTAKDATITIVDNVFRALPLLIQHSESLKDLDESVLLEIIYSYRHEQTLDSAEKAIRSGV